MRHYKIMTTIAVLTIAAVVFCQLQSVKGGGDKKKYPNPLPRKEQILKRFVKEFVLITPGRGMYPASFVMGSKIGPPQEKPAHKVTFAKPFAIAKYEVTQELYHVVMGDNPSKWKGVRNSVELLTWDDAVEFCRKATAELRKRKLLAESEEIRLPSEAEWEYCCRAGTLTAYSFGNDLKQLTHFAWYKDNSKGYDPPVGAKKPNNWGLYDMHGYIWEWCADVWTPNYKGAPADGSARVGTGKERVMRSGSWAHSADQCRCSYRGHSPANTRSDKIGFRCVRAATK